MLSKMRQMVSAGLVFLLVAALTDAAVAATGRSGRKVGQPRLRRTPKYMLELGDLQLLADFHMHSRHVHDASFRNRSLSPWTYKEDKDANRYPSSIFKAQCVSTHCFNSRGFKDPGLNTRLVKQEMLVLKKKSSPGNKITFHVEKLLVPVACVCVRPEVLSA
ncbi:interleukin-17A-like [Narcine bancroftii]|uniref:interleukin-17A-like n=1 Tax=Narcine bancroftii TaxID=1343680 RepID=UPI0038317E71